jgi:uncharacterized membrane protein
MNSYEIFKIVHIFSAIALVGPLLLTPRWLYLYQHNMGKKLLHELHLLTGVAGWIVFVSGILMLWVEGWSLLSTLWIQISLSLFIGIQLFDHFWADKREEDLENDNNSSLYELKVWFIVKILLYLFITFLMVVKVI